MATTYDKASLVMIPSGYKDDKLYSIKPTDGSGDFTFSRDGAGASPATRVNASGLIEKGRENLLLQSNNFDTSPWSHSWTFTYGQLGYDGSNNSWRADFTSGATRLQQVITATSQVHTASIYLKYVDVQWIRLMLAGTDEQVWFDIQNGVIGTESSVIDASIESVGNGYYRCSLTGNNSIDRFRVYPVNADNSATQVGGSLLIQNSQFETSLVATAPAIETTTAPVSAGLLGDMPRLDYSGGATCPSLLLEPSRVNVIEHSEYLGEYGVSNVSVSYNNATSPEGVQNATLVTGDAGTFTKVVNFNPASSGAYTISVFAKYNTQQWIQLGMGGIATYANFDIQNGVKGNTNGTSDIEDYGDGWYRCSVQMTSGTPLSHYIGIVDSGTAARLATSTSTGSFWAYGMQSEIGSYPTSYIPTYGSASGRADETCLDSTATDLIGQTEGTLFFECTNKAKVDQARYFSLSDGTGNNRIDIYHHTSDRIGIYVAASGAAQVNVTNVDLPASGSFKFALAYANNDYVWYVNGTQIATDTSAGVPAMSHTLLGTDSAGGANGGNNPFKQALLFKTRLTNAELAALTTL
jgi:hypothetical protein